ncbi:MAG: protein kinase [Gemmataceae bacterium]|nr:protein kinase [Gemmataceae bacterium]
MSDSEPLAAFRRALEAGERPDPDLWAGRHPGLADEFRRLVGQAATASDAPRAAPALDRVGDYDLLAEIARGGMGVVFRARHRALGREVAVKMMLSGALAGERELARFKAEAEAVAALDHPHILPVHEVGEQDGLPWFSMKLAQGGSLVGKRFDPRDAAALVATVARAVHHAHQRGIIHRDLKPANILLDADSTPYVSDFGIAKRAGEGQTLTGQIMGTPSYMPPEQARADKALTVAADTYSLGAILYHLLSGRPPFFASTPVETVLQVIEKEAVPLPGDLGVIAARCLRKLPAERYASAADLADDLDRWLAGKPIQARPVGSAERFAKWVRRNPLVAFLAAACVLALVAGTVVSALFASEARKEADAARRQEAESRRRLARSHVLAGNRLLDEGDGFGALVWYAEALKLDAGTERERFHRLRLGMALRQWPALVSAWKRPDEEGVVALGAALNVAHARDELVVRDASGAVISRIGGAAGHVVGEIAADGRTLLVTVAPELAGTPEAASFPRGRSARLWDMRTGKPLSEEVSWKPGPSLAQLAPDGRRVLLAWPDGRVAVRDLRTGREAVAEERLPDARTMQMTPDGRRLLLVRHERGKARMHVLDGASLKRAAPPREAGQEGGRPPFCRLSADGKELLVGREDEAERLAVADGKRLGGLPLPGLSWLEFGPGGLVGLLGREGVRVFGGKASWLRPSGRLAQSVEFAPAGGLLAAIEGPAMEDIRLYDALSGAEAAPALRHGTIIASLAFSADGGTLRTVDAAGLDRGWLVRRPDPSIRLAGPWPDPPAWSSDGRRIVAGKRSLDARTGEPVDPPAPQEPVGELSASSARLRVAVDKGRLRAWGPSGEALFDQTLPARRWFRLAVPESGDRVFLLGSGPAFRETELHLLDARNGTPLAAPATVLAGVKDMHASRDGSKVALFTVLNETVQVRDGATGAVLVPRLPADETQDGTNPFSPDGTMILSAGRLYDAATGDPLGPPGAVPSILAALTEDGAAYAAKGEDGRWSLRRLPLAFAEGTPEELLARCEALACRRVNDAGALTDLSPGEVLARMGR